MSPGTRLEKVKVITLASMPEREEDNTKTPQAVNNNTKVDTEIPF